MDEKQQIGINISNWNNPASLVVDSDAAWRGIYAEVTYLGDDGAPAIGYTHVGAYRDWPFSKGFNPLFSTKSYPPHRVLSWRSLCPSEYSAAIKGLRKPK